MVIKFKSLPIYSIFFLFLALTCLKIYANDDNNSHTGDHAQFSLRMDTATQAITGIKTQELQYAQLNPEIETFAIRVNIAPLINTRKEYFIALAQQETASIKLKQAQRNVQRLQNLQRDRAVSARKLHQQQTQLKIDQVLFNSSQQQVDNIKLYTQAKWGEVLSHKFLSADYPLENLISTLTRPLYRVILPIHTETPSKTIFLQPFGIREQAHSATFVAEAPPLDNNYQQQPGTPFLYISDEASGSHHQRVTAWLPSNKDSLTGIIIPASAIVWHLGLTFVYLQVDDELFKRIKITQKKLINNGAYFIRNQLQQGDILVSTGAQMLLSEEFREQIPAEDDDDDD